jgi:valyl-tRNA synthetase
MTQFFNFEEEEPKIYNLWLSRKIGSLRPSSKAPFVLTMPPPNANGELHLGHVFGYVTMDILGRFHRAKGSPTLLLPGKDHAGIQTQVVFEKKLKSEGIDPHSMSREELYNRCAEFCLDRATYMRSQEQSIGISADWDKEFFTLDERLNKVVYETFIQMWNDGLIYRGLRIVNWSVLSQTAISDVEVEYQEQKGSLWFIKYRGATLEEKPIKQASYKLIKTSSDAMFIEGEKLPLGALYEIDGNKYCVYSHELKDESISGGGSVLVPFFGFELITATTRPETLLGDTALAVHPDDPRYKSVIGQKVKVPLLGYEIPIIATKKIDPLFGTGVVKVTPAHDFLDYEIGEEANLEKRQVIDKFGRMTELAGPYAGLTVLEARKKVIEDLGEDLIYTKTITHKVPISERGKDVIEPLLSEQWWVRVDKPELNLKERALKLLRDGKIKIYPENFLNQVIQWFENLKDWNISRQLWWGHRIPIWRKDGEVRASIESPGDGWIQEEDTFDTWFSSGQWPYATVSAAGLFDLKNTSPYFPTHTMVMGRDILFFWACRMILFAAYKFNDVPFKNLYFHGLIRDERGQKMSKSKGNGIEPKEMLKKYGADALRLGMIVGTSPGVDLKFSPKKIEGYSKFTNKLWNAAKLIEMKFGSELAKKTDINLESSKWILNQVEKVFNLVEDRLSNYAIPQAADFVYDFVWFTYCDWYLEMMKVMAKEPESKFVTAETFRTVLLMLHPFIPFITEAIYQKLTFLKTTETLAELGWSCELKSEGSVAIEKVIDVITAIRQVKAGIGAPYSPMNVNAKDLSLEQRTLIEGIARVTFVEQINDPLRKPFRGGEVLCDVRNKEIYREYLLKELKETSNRIRSCESKLASDFSKKADPKLVEEEETKLKQLQASFSLLKGELEGLSSN